MIGFTKVHAHNSVYNSVARPYYIFIDLRATLPLVKRILLTLYLFEGMSRKDALLLSARDAYRNM